MNGIRVKNLTKRYRDVTALDNVSVEFRPERIYGLLGRNGAGKTTLLNVLSNRIFADEGEVTIDGMPARENDAAQSRLYMTGEKTLFPDAMKVSDAFRWTSKFFSGFRADLAAELADRFELNVKNKLRSLSTGYSSIFQMITALCVDVPYVLLDEPVLGLDANHRELFYRTLLEVYAARPRTFIISTHLIEEAAGVIEDVVIIKKGSVIRDQSAEQLLSSGYTVSGTAAAVDAYAAGREVLSAEMLGGLKSACILGVPDREHLPEGAEISALDLQKLFIRLTNE